MKRFLKKSIIIFSFSVQFILAQTIVDLSQDWEENHSFSKSNELDSIIVSNIADLSNILGFIVIHDGKIISEDYYNNSFRDDIFNIWSVTKSFTSTLIGQASDMGILMEPDSMLSQFLTQYDLEYLDEISLHNLLTMSSGYSDEYQYDFVYRSTENLISMDHGSPGQFFYSNSACHINSHILYYNCGATPNEFANNYLFPYLGYDNPQWDSGFLDINNGSISLYLTLREMVKLGQLYIQNGFSGSSQILSEDWIEKATSAQIPAGIYWENSFGLSKYGYLWWIPEGNDNVYFAWGYGGQFIAVMPERHLLIGTRSTDWGPGDITYHTASLVDIIVNILYPFFETIHIAPSGLEANVGESSISVSWNSIENDEFQYFLLERSTSEDFNSEIVSLYSTTNSIEDDDLVENVNYYYRVSYYANDWSEYSEVVSATLENVLLDSNYNIPNNFTLNQNYPNPFNPVTNLSYTLFEEEFIEITIFDINGSHINTLISDRQSPGFYSIQWVGDNQIGQQVGSGLYIYMLRAGDRTLSKKMLFLK